MEKRIYKNLYYDTETKRYYFINGTDKQQVKEQEGYLLIYLIEILLNNANNY